MGIRIVSAENGRLVLKTDAHIRGYADEKFIAHNANEVVKVFEEHGISESGLMVSSSMDFADEYGFKNRSSAMIMLSLAMELFEEKCS